MSKEKSSKIEDYIKIFMDYRAAAQEPRFYMETLRQSVQNQSGKIPAPGSVDRILRMMKKAGKVNYTVINRQRSLYLALPLTLESQQ